MQEKSCENCVHYIQHYRKSNTKFVKVFWGHCTKKLKPTKQSIELKPCMHWEETELPKPLNENTIYNIFNSIHNNIDDIAMFLKNYNQ